MLRGDIHDLRLPKGVGHEQLGRRLGVVVQSDAMLPRSVVLIAPTSTSARPASFRPELDVRGERTRVLVEQLGAVDVNRLGDQVGGVTVTSNGKSTQRCCPCWASTDQSVDGVLGPS